ncbi:spondin domain-containing protein [Nitrosomonas marina]|uniref:Spondin_N n=1 Tax=Nitrosomonas marina TaxID=917 RepID=A0A1H8BR96_9PROT|nr:spondin domain-containing protein [Nitrosomonas marina]SEM85292.1 Spondin_N [Nitrosomonas marina]
MASFQKIIVFLSFAASYQLAVAADYRVEITSLTYKTTFKPRIVIAHVPVSLCEPCDNLNDTATGLLNGQMNHALSEITEADSLGPIMAILDQESVRKFVSYVAGSGLLVGCKNQTVEFFDVDDAQNRLSLFAMLLPTNDGFIALNNMALPQTGSVQSTFNAYDAGTETNTESCEDIPGPLCGGTAQSPDDTGEGFVHIHRGIGGLDPDEIDPAEYDWKIRLLP